MRLVERANEPLIQDNDEVRMTNDEGNANDEVRSNIAKLFPQWAKAFWFDLRISSFLRPSSFALRHSPSNSERAQLFERHLAFDVARRGD